MLTNLDIEFILLCILIYSLRKKEKNQIHLRIENKIYEEKKNFNHHFISFRLRRKKINFPSQGSKKLAENFYCLMKMMSTAMC